MPSTVLILGAAGRLGRLLASAFSQAGWDVVAQARKPLPDNLASRPGVRALRCDATDRASLCEAAQGALALVNALNPPYTEWDPLALRLADAALAAARSSGALLMLPGNVYNFGKTLPPVLAPDAPEIGDTPKARIRIEMEARLGAAAREGLDSVVIRAGDFFGGPGPGTWLDMAIASRLSSGRFTYPGRLEVLHPWAYLPDLAEVFVRVASRRAQLRGHHRLHFAGHAMNGNVLKAALEESVGRPLRASELPWGWIRLGSPFVPMWRELLAMRYLWERPHVLDETTLGELIGAVPRTALSVALRSALVEARLQPTTTELKHA